MFFNSIEYLIFFPVVTAMYFLLPQTMRWVLLLAASYFFYMWWEPWYILLILASTGVDYWCSISMSKKAEVAKRAPYMAISVVSNLLILLTFKYFNFFSDATHSLASALGMEYMAPHLEVLLPMGISFYTLQTMGYSIDVYKGSIKPEKHLGIFALYVTFFPQLVAGPIERAKTLLPQFRRKHTFSYPRTVKGLRLILIGLFKKVVVADQISIPIDYLYAHPQEFGGISIWITAFLFAFQVYCDFAGYSDIAVGSAKILGFDLMTNFKRPFLGRSMAGIWARWHLSLTTWFRDYLFTPMIRKRVSWKFAFIAIYVISGLWHGANYTFIIWGVYNGGIIVLSRMMPKTKAFIHGLTGLAKFPKLDKFVDQIVTFLIFCVPSMFFRAPDIGLALDMFASQFVDLIPSLLAVQAEGWSHIILLDQSAATWAVALSGLAVLLFVDHYEEKHNDSLHNVLDKFPKPARFALYIATCILVVAFSGTVQEPFIYFRF